MHKDLPLEGFVPQFLASVSLAAARTIYILLLVTQAIS